MDQIEQLIGQFRPHRHYQAQGISLEVDGAFLRVDETLESQRGQKTLEIETEDLLQDLAIVRSARVSTDRGLINALYRDRHETPFEGGVVFRLKITTPICYAQPFFQIFASHNEFSGRYNGLPTIFPGPMRFFSSISTLVKVVSSVWKVRLPHGPARPCFFLWENNIDFCFTLVFFTYTGFCLFF